MNSLPLPPHPDLKQYKKRAKELVAAVRSKDAGAVRVWARDWLGTLAKALGVAMTPQLQEQAVDQASAEMEKRVRKLADGSRSKGSSFTLADAQFLLAGVHGFENWSEFVHHLDRTPRKKGQEFEAAVDAVVAGDIAALKSLIEEHPDLIRGRSKRKHASTLLHYVAANGVEDWRQRTPPNAVEIARLVLESGAEVDALADTYGRDKYQTTMNLLVSSAHPAGAGLQAKLVETLLDFGAAINGLKDDSSPLMTALAFGYRDAAEALARRGARVDNVIAAAALGQADLVKTFVVNKNRLKAGVPLVAPEWLRLPEDAKTHIELALVWACKFGRTKVADLLLEQGVDPAAKDTDKMSALHWAAANRLLELVKRLIKRGVPLEAENRWGGTVLNSTLHFALYQPTDIPPSSPDVDYPVVIETVLAAGADVSVAYPFPTGNEAIDEVLRRHGARNS